MLIDLKVAGKHVVVVGASTEAQRKVSDFLEAGANILVVSQTFSAEIAKLGEQQKIAVQKETVEDAEAFIDSFDPKPDIVVALTNDHDLNAQLIGCARAAGCLAYAPDNPAISDFILPAVAKVGDVKVAVSTGGKSPAMASELRQRIEKLITPQDLAKIRLQEQIREILKEKVPDQKARRQLLYQILGDPEVNGLLERGKFEEAKAKALEAIENC
jgi:precorrin-2 dehydrogenase/sirohydrochlorin ferrochelatase